MGVSNETSYGISQFVAAAGAGLGPRIVSTQNSYSLLVRTPYETDLAETCCKAHLNVGLLAYSPLAGGALTGKYADGTASSKARFNLFEGYMARYMKSLAREAVLAYCDVAKKYGMTPATLNHSAPSSHGLVRGIPPARAGGLVWAGGALVTRRCGP